MFCRNFAKIVPKKTIFNKIKKSQKMAEWPNGQIILFLANCFKKGQMATLMTIKE
jgi:hypothetical protein